MISVYLFCTELCMNDWKLNPNKSGRWFKRYLDNQTWDEIERTFVGASIEDIWVALL
jgi:aminoglycoside 6-adenylyltransferase